jgi:general secretion pathway protein K
MNMTSRRAFVLIAVLSVMVGVSTLGVGIALVARRAVAAARNRIADRRAGWIAEGCASRAQAAIAQVLGDHDGIASDSTAWRSLAFTLHASRSLDDSGCNVTLRAAGSVLDINAVDSGTLARLLRTLGTAPAVSDSLVEAILDWRDADDVPRPFGAERAWYAARRRPLPRNGPFADIRELDRVRGASTVPGLDTLLGTERGRVSMNEAPLPVIAALPGFTREAVALVAEHRARHAPLTDLFTFASELSPGARDTLESHFGELVQFSTTTPDAWVLTSRGTAGDPPITEVVELRLVWAGPRAAVVRRRTWIE